MNPTSALSSALFLDVVDLVVEGDLAVGRRASQATPRAYTLCAWGLADGALRWEIPAEGPFALGEGRLLTARTGDDAVVRVEVRDPLTAAVERSFSVSEMEEDYVGAMRVADGRIYLCGGWLRARSLTDGSLLARAEIGSEWASMVGCSARSLVISSEEEALSGYERPDLALRWTSTERVAGAASVVGERVLAGVVDPTDDYAPLIVCLDADSGRRLWAFAGQLELIGCVSDLVLTTDALGWLTALDLATGAFRWKQWLGANGLGACAVPGGAVVRCGGQLVALDLAGELVARYDTPTTGRLPLAYAAGRLLCGAASAVAAAIDARPPVTGPEPVCDPVAPSFVWSDGAAFHSPVFGDLAAVRAVIAAASDLDEAWEALAARGIVPDAWVGGGERVFVDDANEPSQRPRTRGAMVSVAGSVAGMLRAEALLRESVVRAAVWASIEPQTSVRWRLALSSESPGWPPDDGFLRGAVRALLGSVPSEAAARQRTVSSQVSVNGAWCEPWVEQAMVHEALWRMAAAHGLRVRGSERDGDAFDALPNPFAPLLDITALGYGWNPSGELYLPPFEDDLTTLRKPPDDDIPF